MANSADLVHPDVFRTRHIGPRADEQREMLALLGYESLDAFIDAVVPDDIRLRRPLALPPGRDEREVLQALRRIASQNQLFRSYLGMGYHACFTPQVIQRNVLENPGWYTAYTPYQAEIAQGRLEALLNFQTMVSDLTGLEIANASLLDEATAAAEAMHVTEAVAGAKGHPVYCVDEQCHPQTIAVVRTRAEVAGDRNRRGRSGGVPVRRRRDRRARAVSGHRRPVARLPRPVRAGARGRRPRHRGDRPARAHAPRAPGRVGRRHRRRQQPAVRRPDGLRRPARGVLRHPRRPQAASPGPHHRRVQGPRRTAGAAHGAADARAAHPPREGDQQHLHGAGPARGDGEDVRRLSRPRGPAPHRRAGARVHRAPGQGAAAAGLPAGARRVLRHAVRRGRAVGPAAPAGRRLGAPHQPPRPSARLASSSRSTRPSRSTTWPT